MVDCKVIMHVCGARVCHCNPSLSESRYFIKHIHEIFEVMYVHVKGVSVSSCSDSCCDSLFFQATYNLSSPSLPPVKLC